jgi:aryl-phospho-beta-D-glucosidase BglC (GH1 family)
MDWGVYCENCSANQFLLMRRDWNANVVRLSVNQAFWLNTAPKVSMAYAAELARVITAIEKAGMDVIVDSHRSSTGYMADANSVVFWKEVATVYRDDPHVLFELFNEPHDISWDLWLKGGTAPNGSVVHGMQELYNAVRSTGANNLVVVGGLNWAYELSGIATHRVVGNNIVYATHPYNYPGKQPSDWDRAFGALAATDPIIATEFGNYDCSKGYYQAFVDYARAHKISWTAWAWYPGGCGFPGLITDSNGTPNAPGEVVKAALWNP